MCDASARGGVTFRMYKRRSLFSASAKGSTGNRNGRCRSGCCRRARSCLPGDEGRKTLVSPSVRKCSRVSFCFTSKPFSVPCLFPLFFFFVRRLARVAFDTTKSTRAHILLFLPSFRALAAFFGVSVVPHSVSSRAWLPGD